MPVTFNSTLYVSIESMVRACLASIMKQDMSAYTYNDKKDLIRSIAFDWSIQKCVWLNNKL